MNDEQTVTTEHVQNDKASSIFEYFIKESIKHPLSPGFDARGYCRKCKGSFDMTIKMVQVLINRNPACFSKLPPGIDNLHEPENLRKCYFVLEPCFACSKNAIIKTEVRLKPPIKWK